MSAEERDFTQLTDDEVMNLGPADFERMAANEQAAQEQTQEPEEQTEAAEEEAGEGQKQEEEESQAEDEQLPEETDEERLERESQEEADLDEEELAELRANREAARVAAEAKATEAKPAKAPAKEKAAAKEPSSDGFDADGAKKLFEPFTANGHKMQIRTPEEGVRLMQLGAGYNAKMAELKPKLAIVRTLERAGLLDNEKLSYLIDLHNKNPEAIGKLVKESGVDVLDLDESKVAGYKPKDYSTSTKEVELDEALDALKHSPSYSTLMDNVANKWDRDSKSEVGNNPAILTRINDHMNAGFYDKIVEEVNRQKALGTISSGTPFLKAYAQVGDELNAAGAFGQQEATPAKKLVTAGKDKARSARQVDEQRRKAAAPTKTGGNPTPKKPVVDVWNMSDADFEKLKI